MTASRSPRSIACAFVGALAWLGVSCLAPPARAEDDLERRLSERIDQLEREVQELRTLLKQRKKTAAPGPSAAARKSSPAGSVASAPEPPAPARETAPTTAVAAAPVPSEAASGALAPEGAVATPGAAPVTTASTTAPSGNGDGVTLGSITREVTDRVKLGGYGSTRFEASSAEGVKNSFQLRRLVLTTDSNIAPRLRAYTELEFERFSKLELEKSLSYSDGEFKGESTVEGTNSSEIALEQAWVEFEATDEVRMRGGAVLVPIGRFNLNHDDNRWDTLRRPLVDRGVPVLPATAAWSEVGAGFTGNVELGRSGLLDYQIYVLNGAVLDPEIETVAEARQGDTTKAEIEVVVSPNSGTFGLDVKNAKAVSGRLNWSPTLGYEMAGSFYWGQYTPDYLPAENVYTLAWDGAANLGPIEMQSEFAYTHFAGIQNVARGFAERAINKETAIENETTEVEVKFDLANLASEKMGYWLYLRYPFFPEFLRDTFVGRPFDNPQFALFAQPEQVWFRGLVDELEYENGELTSFSSDSRILNRFTAGLSYRPTPLVVFSIAYEYTHTNSGKSLASVTNYLPTNDSTANTFLAGAAFGF